MRSICFYFQVHQPPRLKPYSYFQVGHDHTYFDDQLNCKIFRRVAEKCYLPTNRLLLELIDRAEGRLRIAFSLTGIVVEQMLHCDPRVLESFRALAKTGCVEFLAETYYHSLASLFDESEFRFQVAKHRDLIERVFGQRPKVFRNTELIYDNRIGEVIEDMGFTAALAEGADDILDWRSPNFIYRRSGGSLKLLLKNYRWSDDIAFRFSNPEWEEYPLTPEKFASRVHAMKRGQVVNLFMDYETFGEHQWESTGIFEFLRNLPSAILKNPEWNILTPSQLINRHDAVDELSFSRVVSWADLDRDITAWHGNHMQRKALAQIYELGGSALSRNNPMTADLWRKLQASDHFYYMCTKGFADGDVHAYFNPYKNPYEAFINYMNIMTDFKDSVLIPKGQMRTSA